MQIGRIVVVVCLVVGSVFAAPPPNHPPEGPASIVINDADPTLGEYVTFTVTAPKSHFDKRIQVLCFQQLDADPELDLAYAMADAWDAAFHLGGGSSDWLTNGGPASCRADLYYWSQQGGRQTFHFLASTTFAAAGN